MKGPQDLRDLSTSPYLDIQDKYGRTALHYACRNNNI